jgi:hypothetical protein
MKTEEIRQQTTDSKQKKAGLAGSRHHLHRHNSNYG